MENKEKIKYLKDIYLQQHYFIDRHDSMSEKYINTLTYIATALTVLFSLNIDGIKDHKTVFAISFTLLISSLSVAIIKVMNVFNPLSKHFIKNRKKINYRTEDINDSFIYYRGIINRVNNGGDNKFIEDISIDNLLKDFMGQIYILAKYCEEKRERLENAKKWVIGTVLMSIVNAVLILYINII